MRKPQKQERHFAVPAFCIPRESRRKCAYFRCRRLCKKPVGEAIDKLPFLLYHDSIEEDHMTDGIVEIHHMEYDQ